MHNKIKNNFWLVLLAFCVLASSSAHAFTCTPQICVGVGCATGTEEVNSGYKTVDKGFVARLKISAAAIMMAISAADSKMSRAIMSYSAIRTNLSEDLATNMIKTMEGIQEERKHFAEDHNSLKAAEIAAPSDNLTRETTLKASWPATEALTRAMRQQLYADHVQRTELEHEDYYNDKTNIGGLTAYDNGTIAGISKLFQTHRQFFCDPSGANKPSGCFEKGANPEVKMGDQMLEIYLGEETWPKEQVQKAIELMQFYLGISPPDLPPTTNFSIGEGQRAFIGYQTQLARNNFLTYIMSYLVSKRAPTNTSMASIIAIRKEAAGCANPTKDNLKICNYLNEVLDRDGKASRIELSKALEYDQFMNPAYVDRSIEGTLGIDKDITMMLANRLQQDYEEYQMDKMMTASLAGYYAALLPAAR